MSKFKTFKVKLTTHGYYEGTVKAEDEDCAIARTYQIWRTMRPHPFNQSDEELHHVEAEEVTS